MLPKTYLAINKDINILKQSSSGGVFYELAKYTLDNKGIVFGAAWNKNWLVDMCYIDKITDLPKLMGSKYIQANIGNTFEICKKFLDLGSLVLYTGLPCQLHGLKKYLKKDYDNLILVDIACHGLMPIQVWKDYLETIKRPDADITSINFRLKDPDWNNYAFEVKYSDGKILKEHHNKNKYMNAFLSDKYLKASCYDCKFKNSYSISDLCIGDAWGIKSYSDQKNGISFIKVLTEKGSKVLNRINIKLINYNYITNGSFYPIKAKPEQYDKNIFKKRVGIVTLHLNSNFGGILQAYALQTVIKNLGYSCETITWKDDSILNFASKNLNLRILNNSQEFNKIKETDYDIVVVGSDQIWRKQFLKGDFKDTYLYYPFLGFTNNWKINRLAYAASIGVSGRDWEYTEDECKIILETLKFFNGVSVRELQSELESRKKFGKEEIIQAVDPTLLLTAEQYKEICKDIPKNKTNVFAYILDSTDEKRAIISNYCKNNNYSLNYNTGKNIETWLASFRDTDYVITDSFHGCIFSIIFNKPFICLYNKWRGGARFESLLQLLNTTDNIIYNINDLPTKKFNTKLVYKALKERIQRSKEYLVNTLAQPAILMQSSTIILPKKEQKTTQKQAEKDKQKIKQNENNNYLYF